ncbi:hypothetical protein [Sinorhizobium meliloti]|uniref:hypothetical protein n=1 Tax=Rhizobium meliloti TaxID=382 RepID=UPI000FDA5407|nr:hypothetical protein [Sinorhizobium meliloti]MDW9473485.1 hypothetical protein [Sinorhizobium meliloti]RVI81719.1 hypothetical protein CN188_13690 [Sinorhizobium meliloti]RVP20671.1 hypothetical protein CN080_21575 [Sinorhizobium meliloti]
MAQINVILALVSAVIVGGLPIHAFGDDRSDFAIITVDPVDDYFKCVLNEKKTIVDLKFNEGTTVNFLKDLVKGPNKLHCTISDKDKGNVFAYSYTVSVKIGNAVVFHVGRDFCSGVSDRPCRRLPGDNQELKVVLEDEIWINNYPSP